MGLCTCLADCVADNPQSVTDDKSSSIASSVRRCHAAAKETAELCTSTLATGRDLASCGESIQRSLVGAASDLDAESFAVIADLIDGDKAREARGLAATMKERSGECIKLSVRMVKSLEESVDALPDVIESYVQKKAQQSVSDELTAEEREIATRIDDDANELTTCIDAIENLKLLTAVEAGRNAFDAIKNKSKLCNKVFQMMKKFAEDVLAITQAIADKDASTVLSKIKDGSILKAIGLSKYIKQFAEGCKKVMDKIIELFRGASGKLTTLWKALAHAKDVMVDSLTKVVDARSLCGEASEKTEKLKQMTSSMANVEALKLVKRFTGSNRDRSMDDAEGTARDINAGMEEAASIMKNAARGVGEEFGNLPDIVTDGINDDADDEVAESFGAKIRDVDDDVRELESASSAIENSDAISAAKSIHRAMRALPDKVDTCQDMVGSFSEFADASKSSIDSFLGKWSLETAVSHVREMCKMVSLSKLLEQLADRIHRLMKAIATLLKVMSAKIQAVADSIGLDSVVDAAGDLVTEGVSSVLGKMFG